LSNKQRIRLGLIGTGTIGMTHLTGISALIEAELLGVDIVAVCDIDSDALTNAATLFDIKTTYENYIDLIEDEHVDVVYICTPTNKHGDMVKAAAKAKKHIFCEKPLAHSWAQAQDLVAVTKSEAVEAGVGLVLRYDQFLLFAKNLIAEYDFGTPMLAHIRDDQRFPIDYVYYSKWRGDKSIAGGGTLIEHSIHDVDLLRWFFGEVESVHAKVNFFAGREVEDHASLIMTHQNGTVSTLDSVWHWVERNNERMIEFFFEKGYIGIRLESGKRYLEYHLQGKSPVRIWDETANDALLEFLNLHTKNLKSNALEAITAVGSERYAAMNYAFLSALKSGQVLSPNFMDAAAAHRIVDAAYESATNNETITLL